MADNLVIQDVEFTVHPPYVAGHVLNENEAKTLNQTWKENIRNNFAKTVSEGVKGGKTQAVLQSELDEYASDYEFNVRTGGGRVTDPVEQEARRLAKAHVIAKVGKGTHTQAAITEAAMGLLAHEKHGPKLRAIAQQNVDDMRRAASSDIADAIVMPASDE